MGGKLDGAGETVTRFASCEECGGKCCKFFLIPANDIRKPDVERYFKLRVNTKFHESPRLGRVYVIKLPCKNLTPEGRCADYENRPQLCRDMNDFTLSKFAVPAGCKYDRDGELGEDFGV